jgi:hypothetical protein
MLKVGCRRKLVEAPESGRSARAQVTRHAVPTASERMRFPRSFVLDPTAVCWPDTQKIPPMVRAMRGGLVSEPRRSAASGRMSG